MLARCEVLMVDDGTTVRVTDTAPDQLPELEV
jgi:hypothetical protein